MLFFGQPAVAAQRGGDALDQALHHVDRLENQVHVVADQFEFGSTRHVQQVLGLMGQILDVLQFDEAGQALDRVERAEDGVERLGLVRVLFDGQQMALGRVEMFDGFGHEVVDQVGVAVEHVVAGVGDDFVHHCRGFDDGSRLGLRLRFDGLCRGAFPDHGQDAGDGRGVLAAAGVLPHDRHQPVLDLEQTLGAGGERLVLHHVLGRVAELGDMGHAQQRGFALQRVEEAQQTGQVAFGAAVLDGEQLLLDLFEHVGLARQELAHDGLVHHAEHFAGRRRDRRAHRRGGGHFGAIVRLHPRIDIVVVIRGVFRRRRGKFGREARVFGMAFVAQAGAQGVDPRDEHLDGALGVAQAAGQAAGEMSGVGADRGFLRPLLFGQPRRQGGQVGRDRGKTRRRVEVHEDDRLGDLFEKFKHRGLAHVARTLVLEWLRIGSAAGGDRFLVARRQIAMRCASPSAPADPSAAARSCPATGCDPGF